MYLCYELKLPKDQAISFFGWTSTDMLDEVYPRFNEIQRAELLEKNLDEVGFFKDNSSWMFIDSANGKVYFGKEAEVKGKEAKAEFKDLKENETAKMDDYQKHYHKKDIQGGYDIPNRESEKKNKK
jgi:hypothetical protein